MEKMNAWWDAKTPLVRAYLNGSHSLDEGTVMMLEWNLTQGDSNPEHRNRYKQNITNTITTMKLPLSLGGQVQADATVYFASHPLYGRIQRGRGRCYADADDYATTTATGVYNNLMTYYKNHTEDGPKDASKAMWDGTLSKGVPNITYPEEYAPQEDA